MSPKPVITKTSIEEGERLGGDPTVPFLDNVIALHEEVKAAMDGVTALEPWGANKIEQEGVDPRTGLPISYSGSDYVPGKNGPSTSAGKPKSQSTIGPEPVFTCYSDKDYVGGDESAKRSQARATKLNYYRKQVVSNHEKELKRFKKALLMVKKASHEERKNPEGQLARAIEIIKDGLPITPELVEVEAKKRLYASENS